MADIKMIKFHALPLAKAKQVVQKAADDLAAEYDVTSEWHGDTLRFHRSGVEGQMKVSASEIHLDVSLGFLLKPFKARFVEAIEHNFDRLLSGAAKGERAEQAKGGKQPPRKAAKKGAGKAPRRA